MLYATICGPLAYVPAYVVYAGATSGGYTASGVAVGAAIVVAGAGAGAILGSASPRWETIYPEKHLDEKSKAWRSKLER